MRDTIVSDMLNTVDSFRCVNRRLHPANQLSMSDMLVFGAVLHAKDHDGPPPKMSDIASHAGLSTAAISQITGQLEKKGLVERYSMPDDRRTVYLRITDAGQKVFDEEAQNAKKKIATAIEQLGEEKSEQFIALAREFQNIIRNI